VFEYFKALMLKNSAPPKVSKPPMQKQTGVDPKKKLTVPPTEQGTDNRDKKQTGEIGTSGASTSHITGARDRAGADAQQISKKPVVPSEDAKREDSEARDDLRITGAVGAPEESKEPVMAFESHHTEMSEARYSPEPPKAEDYMDDEEDFSYDQGKARETRLAKERAAQEEAERLAEANRKVEEAALAERQGKLAGMTEEAQSILSKYN
jgi:hypothetical protein